MSRHFTLGSIAGIVAMALVACSDSSSPSSTAELSAVSPVPAATAVATSTTVTLTFDHPMMPGMEQYVDLHHGGVTGPTVPMHCAWSPDQTTLTCTPTNPLAPGSQHTIHVGGGMTDEHGDRVHMDQWTTHGGQWCTPQMLGGSHDGHPVDMMGHGWEHQNHYGMLFTFTTA